MLKNILHFFREMDTTTNDKYKFLDLSGKEVN